MALSMQRAGARSIAIGLVLSTVAAILALTAIVLSLTDRAEAVEPATLDHNESVGNQDAQLSSRARHVALTRRDKMARLAEIHAGLPPGTESAVEAEERIAHQVAEYAALHGGSPAIESLDCRGETLCRLVLDHLSREAVHSNLDAMRRPDELFGWSGPTISGSGGGPATQVLFLIDEMLVFDGWDIIEREEGPGYRARAGRTR